MKLMQKFFNKQVGHSETPKPTGSESFSQSGEDLIVDFILNGVGLSMPTYLDIGAHHPHYINNTYKFYKRGCRGVNIEPDPSLIVEFERIRSEDVNLNFGVGF